MLSLKDKIKNYSEMTLLKDLPIGAIFGDFGSKDYYCKLSNGRCMELNVEYKDLQQDYKIVDFFENDKPVVPFESMDFSQISNTTLVKLSTLKKGNIFIIPQYSEENRLYIYKKKIHEECFHVEEYTKLYEDEYYFKEEFDFTGNCFVFPVKCLKVVKTKCLNPVYGESFKIVNLKEKKCISRIKSKTSQI